MNTELKPSLGRALQPHRVLGVHPFQQANQPGVTLGPFTRIFGSFDFDGPASLAPDPDPPRGPFRNPVDGETLAFSIPFAVRFGDGKTWELEDPYRFQPPWAIGTCICSARVPIPNYDASGRPLPDHRGKERHGLHPLGAKRQRSACWVISTAGMGVFSPAPVGEFPASGSFSCPCVSRRFVQIRVETQEGALRIKTDPLALPMERPPRMVARVGTWGPMSGGTEIGCGKDLGQSPPRAREYLRSRPGFLSQGPRRKTAPSPTGTWPHTDCPGQTIGSPISN